MCGSFSVTRVRKHGTGKWPRPMTRENHIYREILDAIAEHRCAPGTRLPEDVLAELFDVSRTSIRKILQRLAMEQMVELRPNCGAQVAQPSPQQAQDVLLARQHIEPELQRQIAARLSRTAASTLLDLIKQEDRAQKQGHRSEAIQLSARFHVTLTQQAGNQVLTDIIENLTIRSSLAVAIYGTSHSIGSTCGGHDELLDLLVAKNGRAARDWMKVHLTRIRESLTTAPESAIATDLKSIFG
jgi:DNA-binding GntR family transcriptional regulator